MLTRYHHKRLLFTQLRSCISYDSIDTVGNGPIHTTSVNFTCMDSTQLGQLHGVYFIYEGDYTYVTVIVLFNKE